jgi:integrase
VDQQLELLQGIARALGVTPTASAVTVGALYMRKKAGSPRGRAWRLKRNLLRPFVVAFWRRPAASLRPTDWLEHAAARRAATTRTGAPPCESTINLELHAAKGLLNFGLDSALLDANPLRPLKPVKCRRFRETWLTTEQFETLIAHADALDHRRAELFVALAVAMVTTGMRISEALRVRRDRIGLNGAYVITAARTKSKKARIVAFTSRALQAFELVPPRGSSPFVFASKHNDGKPYDPSAPRHWFRKVAIASGLDALVADGDVQLRPHDLRHSAASIADSRGATATAIRDMLGHASLQTTERYLHRSREQGAIAMAQIMEPRRAAQKSPNVRTKDLTVKPEHETKDHPRWSNATRAS